MSDIESVNGKGKAIPVLAFYRSRGFQEVEASRFLDNRHMKVEGCQPYTPAASTHQEVFLVLIYVRGWFEGHSAAGRIVSEDISRIK